MNGGTAERYFAGFVASQDGGASYEVEHTTNAASGTFPSYAVLKHTHYEEGTIIPRTFELVVTNIENAPDTDLRPPLLAGSSVEQVVEGKTYLYYTSNGQWLSPAQAQKLGTAIKEAPDLPADVVHKTALWTRLVMVMLLLTPVFVFGLAKLRNQSPKTSTK
jgi:hypothetical protein